MARMKFLCDAERCIECNACVTACKNEHEVPWGVNRRRVVTIQDGKPGERSISVACMHCSDAPCTAVAQSIVSTRPTKVWCCTRRICASVVATASMRVRLARRSIRRLVTTAHVEKWTSAPSAPVALKMTCLSLSSKNTVAIVLPRANCQSVQKCARLRLC